MKNQKMNMNNVLLKFQQVKYVKGDYALESVL